jgi:hypothetical protein
MIRASLPVTDCETVICRTGLRSRCPGIGCWSSQPRSAVRRYRPLRCGQWYVRTFYGSYPCRVAQPTVATKMAPSPVAVTVASTSDRKHDSLWRSLSSAPPASRSSAPPSVDRAILGPLAGSSVYSPVSVSRYKRNSGAGDSSTTAPGSPVRSRVRRFESSRRHSWGATQTIPAGAPAQLRRRRFRRGPRRVAAGGLARASLLAGPRDGADRLPGEGDLAGRHVRGVVVADLQPERLEQAAGDRVAWFPAPCHRSVGGGVVFACENTTRKPWWSSGRGWQG